MDEGRNRGRAFHGVRQPGVQAKLGRLAHGAQEQQEGGHRQDVPVLPQEVEGLAGQVGRGLEHCVKRDRAGGEEQREDAKREAEIADAVDDEGLDGGGIGAGFLEPEADQQIRGQADAFPAHVELHEVVGGHQHQHREGEQRQVGEEARAVRIVAHVADAVEMHQRRDGVDHHQHDGGELVDLQRPIDAETAGIDPVQHLDVDHHALGDHQVEGDPGQDGGKADGHAGDRHGSGIADATPEEARDDGGQQGQENDQMVHRHRRLSPSSC